MKNKWMLFGIVGLTGVMLSSFAGEQNGNATQEPKKSRHIKMMKIENGKKMELDTVLTGNDVFVWNGDTINPVNPNRKFRSSGDNKMQQVDVKVDNKGGKEKIMIIKHGGGKSGEPMIWNMDSDDDLEVVTENIDSLGKRIVVRKRMKDGAMDPMIFRNEGHEMLVPPPPPPPSPPMPPFPHMKMQQSGRIIDLNDPKIVSYRKKDVKGGMEKIEIIRKKSNSEKNKSFDFGFDQELIPPVAPDAP